MSQNDDLISRQAAIDAVRELYIQSPKINNDIVYDTAIDQAHDALVNLPSAQTEVLACGEGELSAQAEQGWRVKMSDYIDRENTSAWLYNMGYLYAAKVIQDTKRFPSAQPQRKRGKWVRYDGDWLKTMCKCSECGAMIDINEKYRNFFCYHCGARMEGEE